MTDRRGQPTLGTGMRSLTAITLVVLLVAIVLASTVLLIRAR
ncbi:MAG: hypothetical protein ABR520_10325 [Mycobacteriales bacterium]